MNVTEAVDELLEKYQKREFNDEDRSPGENKRNFKYYVSSFEENPNLIRTCL